MLKLLKLGTGGCGWQRPCAGAARRAACDRPPPAPGWTASDQALLLPPKYLFRGYFGTQEESRPLKLAK